MTYEQRRDVLIADHVARPWPILAGCNCHRGWLNYATACLWLNQNVADANAKLAAVRIDHVTGKDCAPGIDVSRSNLWLGYLIRPYGLHYPGLMTEPAAANLRAQMWAYAKPHSTMSMADDGPWNVYDSENHDACAKSFNLLAAQFLKGPYPTRAYADGSTATDQYEAWRAHWSAWFDEHAKRGLLVEVGSPNYAGYTVQAILNICQFCDDAVLSKKAEMFLDLLFADYACQRLAGVCGGAKSRAYPNECYDGRGDALTNFGDLLWGPGQPGRNNHSLALATSGYRPPAVVTLLATDTQGRGAFEIISRRPGVGPSGWDNEHWHVDPTRSVVDYAWVTPDYVLGCAMLNPANSHIGPSNQNRWQGIQFATTSDARVYPQAAPTSVSKTQDAFLSVQKSNVLITRKRGWAQYPTVVYFPATLDVLDEEAGWVFVREGNVYLAVRPVAGTYAWLDPAKNKAASIDRRFIQLSVVDSPLIFEATRIGGFPFADFKKEIIFNRRTYTNGVLNYWSRIGTQFVFYPDNRPPLVNGQPVGYSPPDTAASPRMSSRWGTGRYEVSLGAARATYDFSNPANPTKVVG